MTMLICLHSESGVGLCLPYTINILTLCKQFSKLNFKYGSLSVTGKGRDLLSCCALL